MLGALVQGVTAQLERHDLARALSDRVWEGLRALVGITLRADGIGLTLDRKTDESTIDRGTELTRLLIEVGTLAQQRGRVLVLLIDEAQNIAPSALADLCYALQEAQSSATLEAHPTGAQLRRHLPIAVYLAGLPGLVTRLQEAGATFFERSRHLDFGLLGDADVREGFRAFVANRHVVIDSDALDLLVERVSGYPYFLHLIGYRVWTAGEGPVITADQVLRGFDAARGELDRFYDERLQALGDLQYDWLVAAAGFAGDQRTTGAVAEALGRTARALGSTVQGLVDRGLVRMTPGRGRFALALPGLDRHLLPS